MPKKYILPIREVDREIFNLIKIGEKKIETRAGGPKYRNIQKGDIVVLKCGKDKLEKEVGEVYKFKNVKEMLKKYNPSDINPNIQSIKELTDMYNSFPGYAERLQKYGIIAFKLK